MHQQRAHSNVIVLKQLFNFIPRILLNQTARKTGVDAKARTFSVLSHVAAMLFAQLSHAISLNDICDWLRLRAASKSCPPRATLFLTQTKYARLTSSKRSSGRCHRSLQNLPPAVESKVFVRGTPSPRGKEDVTLCLRARLHSQLRPALRRGVRSAELSQFT
jgi:hypothetical protein